jgi:subtilisin family serine protease
MWPRDDAPIVRTAVGARVFAGAAAAAVLACACLPGRGTTVAVGYATPGALGRAVAANGGSVVRRLPELRVAEVSTRDVAGLRRAPGIRFVERTTARTHAAEPALIATATTSAAEWQYAATRANAVPSTVLRAAAGVTIGVVDTGADLSAPDIAAKSPQTWSVVGDSGDVRDTSGHGTFVASLAAGSVVNREGVAGFGGDAQLLVVQANRGDANFTDLDEANAVVWAVDHGAKIVNLSLGGPSTSSTERGAIDYAAAHGVLLVAAAGNQYRRGNPVQYPAALIQPLGSNGVGGRGLVVGAALPSGKRAGFSSTGSYLSLVAPGVDVLGALSSTAPLGEFARVVLPGSSAGGYGIGSGTSYAAPQVAGAAALVWAANPALTAAQVAQTLKDTASNRGRWNAQTGYGLLDVAAAVAASSRRAR